MVLVLERQNLNFGGTVVRWISSTPQSSWIINKEQIIWICILWLIFFFFY